MGLFLSPTLLPRAAEGEKQLAALCQGKGQGRAGPHLGTVLGDEEELSEGAVQGEEDARLCHVLEQAVLRVGEELPQGL